MRFSLTPLFFDLQAVLRCRTVSGTAHNKTLKGVVLSRLQAALASWGSEGNHYDLKCSQTSGSVYNLNMISGLPPSFVRFKCIVCDPQKSIMFVLPVKRIAQRGGTKSSYSTTGSPKGSALLLEVFRVLQRKDDLNKRHEVGESEPGSTLSSHLVQLPFEMQMTRIQPVRPMSRFPA